jgi:hypothetical protein
MSAVAPAAETPEQKTARLNAELNAIVREPPTMADINGRGHIAIATPPVAELQRFVQSEIVRWAKVVDQTRWWRTWQLTVSARAMARARTAEQGGGAHALAEHGGGAEPPDSGGTPTVSEPRAEP